MIVESEGEMSETCMDFDEVCRRENYDCYCQIRDNVFRIGGAEYANDDPPFPAPISLVVMLEHAASWEDVLDAVLAHCHTTAGNGASFESIVRGIHAIGITIPNYDFN